MVVLFPVFLFIGWFSSQTKATFQQAALYRDQRRHHIVNGNFKSDPNRRLVVSKIDSILVGDIFGCTFNCVSEPLCKSFNLAVNSDLNDLYLCELLDIHKYRAPKDALEVNAAFYHFSPWSTCKHGLVGIHCERIGKSCSEIKYHSPHAKSGSYVIDPDGEGGGRPFTVFCNMTDKDGVGVTVIGHDSEDRTHVIGYEESGSYIRVVHYLGEGLTNLSQIVVLTEVSTHCEQFIKYECHHSRLLEEPYGWWVSRNNTKMTHWGGATSADPNKCACGVTSPNSCADSDEGCNCDSNDSTWREDSGFLTEKSLLPVLQLKFGDTGHSGEEAFIRLENLSVTARIKRTWQNQFDN